MIELAKRPGFEVQQRDPAFLVVHRKHLDDAVLPVRAPPGAVHHGVLLDPVLHPADLDVLGGDGAVHGDDAQPPRRERFPHLGTGVLFGRLPAFVHEFHEARALRVRGVLARAEHQVLAFGRQPDVHHSFALRDRNLLGQQLVAVAAKLVPALVPFLSIANHPDQFRLLGLEPDLLVGLLLLGGHHGRDLPGHARSDVVFPKIPALGGVRREPRGGKEDLAPIRTQPELTDLAGDRVDRAGAPASGPDVQRALPAPGGRLSGHRPDQVRPGNEADFILDQFPKGRSLPVHREPGIVVRELVRLRVLAPTEEDLGPIGSPAQVARGKAEDPIAASEMIQSQPKSGVGVGGRKFRLRSQLGPRERGENEQQGRSRNCGNWPHGGLLQRISRIRSLAG